MEVAVETLLATSFLCAQDVAKNVSTDEKLLCFHCLARSLALQSFKELFLRKGFVISQQLEERIVYFG